MINVLILGAASQISRFLIPDLLADKTVNLTLFARQAPQRLGQYAGESRVTLVDGDWNQEADIEQVMPNQDIVFLASSSLVGNQNVVTVMKHTGVQRLIVAGGLGIDDEVAGKFGNWNARMMGDYTPYKQAAKVILDSGLNTTYLRMTWLYDENGNEKYQIVPEGQPLRGTQVTRQAVAKLVTAIVRQPSLYQYANIGVVEPGTEWDKPSFY